MAQVENIVLLSVIAGAALASAYDVDDTHDDGMRLILLDEAFNKMDPQNIIATMRYLESLGLQIFLASPGENLATLTALCTATTKFYVMLSIM